MCDSEGSAGGHPCEDQGPVDEAMEHSAGAAPDRGGNAAMMALVDRPFGVMMPSRSCNGVRPEAERYCSVFEMFFDDILLERRWHSVGLASMGSPASSSIAGRWGSSLHFCCRRRFAAARHPQRRPTHNAPPSRRNAGAMSRQDACRAGWLGHRRYSAQTGTPGITHEVGYVPGGRR